MKSWSYMAVPGIEAPSLLGSSEDASEHLLLDASSSLWPSNFGLPLYPMGRTKDWDAHRRFAAPIGLR
jgi:hypothetical protein